MHGDQNSKTVPFIVTQKMEYLSKNIFAVRKYPVKEDEETDKEKMSTNHTSEKDSYLEYKKNSR